MDPTYSAWFFPAGVVDEDAYIMVLASKTTAEEMKRDELEHGTDTDPKTMQHTKWRYAFHPLTSRYDDSEYRRDIALPNGAIVRLEIFYTNFINFTPEQRREDVTTIVRILNSAAPMASATNNRTREAQRGIPRPSATSSARQ